MSFLAIVALECIAKRLRLPPAAALLIGGIGIAFIPGLPPINLDPELVLLVFLPPLLMDGAYFSVWEEFKRNVGGILLLAIGAVVFTTFAVGFAVHWWRRRCRGPRASRSARSCRRPTPWRRRPCSSASRCRVG